MFVPIAGALPLPVIAALTSAISERGRPPAEVAGELERSSRDIVRTLLDNLDFREATHPAAVGSPSLRLYETEMQGDDAAPALAAIRNDIAVVVNLNGEGEYEGGDVVIEVGGFEKRWRGAAGDCIAYPADARRRVMRVTAGRRLLLTFEVQSFVGDPARRQVIVDLSSALRSLDARGAAAPAADRLRRCRDDLLRHWMESGSPRREA